MATRKKTTAKGRKAATKTTAKKTTKRTAAKTTKRTAKASTTRKAATARKTTTTRKAKATTRKSTAKRATTAKRAPATGLSLPSTAISKKQTKAQIYADIAELTELGKPEVKKVFAALKNIVERHVKAKGSGEVTIPELGIKVRRVVKKATKARMGRNPFTGEEIKIAAKPARKSVKASALKALKELAD